MPINFAKAAQINRVADETLKNILSKRDDTPDMYAEINKIDDLEVAKIVIRRLMEKINENTGSSAPRAAKDMQVYIVIEERDMSSFTDQNGDAALDSKEIMGVYSTMQKALALVDSLAAENAKDVADFNCDKCKYWACPYDVKDQEGCNLESCERDNMALLHLTFASRNEVIDWLRAKLTEAHSAVEFMEWLSDFFDQGNTITVCGREYTFMDCYDMI